HRDSVIIESEYLTGQLAGFTHELKKPARARFLKFTEISETDSVFIYNTTTDSVERFVVNNLALIASLSPYADMSPFEQYEYQVGFDLGSIRQAGNVYYHTFVCIRRTNPFVTGRTTPLIWQKATDQLPAEPKLTSADFNRLSRYKRAEAYQFSLDTLNYYCRTYLHAEYSLKANYIYVYHRDGQLLFNKVYFEGESTDLLSLSFESEKNKELTQRTGLLFENMPMVIYGITTESFACRHVDFLDPDVAPIEYLCDNRH
ncbi:MAG: hypothetical protein WBA74_15550, partial [Cyclobacteriaceae bacterium]